MDLQALKSELLSKFPGRDLKNSYSCKIVWNDRMRTTLGRAHYIKWTITLNSRVHRTDEELRQTFAHELAHLVAWEMFGSLGRGHGRRWKYVMRTMGYEPLIYSDNEVAKTLKRSHSTVFTYRCKCEIEHQIKTVKANRIREGAVYRCRGCRDEIKEVI